MRKRCATWMAHHQFSHFVGNARVQLVKSATVQDHTDDLLKLSHSKDKLNYKAIRTTKKTTEKFTICTCKLSKTVHLQNLYYNSPIS